MNEWASVFKRITIIGIIASAVILAINFVLAMSEVLSESTTPDIVLTIPTGLWVACLLTVLIGELGWLLTWLKTKM